MFQPGDDLVEGIVPGDALEDAVAVGSFGRYAPHGIENAVRRINTVKIFRNFAAKESAGDGMLGIALDPGGLPVLDGDEDGASIRTIMRAGRVDYALHQRHLCCDYPMKGCAIRDFARSSSLADYFKSAFIRRPVQVEMPAKPKFVTNL